MKFSIVINGLLLLKHFIPYFNIKICVLGGESVSISSVIFIVFL